MTTPELPHAPDDTAVGAQVQRSVRPLRDLTRDTWANPERMPHMVRAVVRAEVAATARAALRAALVLLVAYLLAEGLKLWAAAA